MIRRKNTLIINYSLLFHIYYFSIEETETFLNMLQSKLISEKKNISQRQEIQKIPKSYPYSSLSHWDLVLRKKIIFN